MTDLPTFLIAVFCFVDDWLKGKRLRQRGPRTTLSDGEVLTIESGPSSASGRPSLEMTRTFLLPLYAALGAGRTIRQAFEAARSALPPAQRDFPVLLGDGVDEPLAPSGRRGAPQIEHAPLHGIPAPAEFRFYGDYIPGDPPGGRQGLLRQIIHALRRGERLLILHGAGGIGKSALAALAAVKENPAGGETARRFDFSYNRLPEPERKSRRRESTLQI